MSGIAHSRLHHQAGGLLLRSTELPFQDVPTTWMMDVAQEALPRPVPAEPRNSGVFPPSSPKGFWNDLPAEEEEVNFSFQSPTDYDRKAMLRKMAGGFDLREMLMLIAATYLIMMLSHLMLVIFG